MTAPESKGSGRDELNDRHDALIASLDAADLIFDKLIQLFEYGGKYAPLAAAELAGELDW